MTAKDAGRAFGFCLSLAISTTLIAVFYDLVGWPAKKELWYGLWFGWCGCYLANRGWTWRRKP